MREHYYIVFLGDKDVYSIFYLVLLGEESASQQLITIFGMEVVEEVWNMIIYSYSLEN